MKLRHTIALGIPLIGVPAMAAELAVKLEIPQLHVAEYHRLPFQWPSKSAQNVSARGKEELGTVSMQIKP